MSQPESADDAASLTTDKDTDRRGQPDQLRATVAPCDPRETVEEGENASAFTIRLMASCPRARLGPVLIN
jgi:hypothetical protein